MEDKHPQHLDVVCKPGAAVEVEVQSRPTGHVLYVHIDGITIARVCRIQTRVRVTDNSTLEQGADAQGGESG